MSSSAAGSPSSVQTSGTLTGVGEIEPLIKGTSVPIIIKKEMWKRNTMLCQVDDPKLNLIGDTGAVGRIKADSTSLQLDIKGRQYSGSIMSGPTVMLLNLAPPVGKQNSIGYQETARAELFTNEFCHLTFTKDVLGTMDGDYTYGEEYNHNGNGNSEDDDDDDESVATNSSRGGGAGGVKKERKNVNPEISQVTNRKRKSTTGKKGGSKKKKK